MEDGKVIISLEEYNKLKEIEKSTSTEKIKSLEFANRMMKKNLNEALRDARDYESHYQDLFEGKDSVYTENRELKSKIEEYENKLKKYKAFVSGIRKSFFKSLFINTQNLPN